MPDASKAFEISIPIILKTDNDQHLVYGWASVIEENGNPVIDLQGDVIEIEELTKAVHEFMGVRQNNTMHEDKPTGSIVESMIFSKEVQKALGIDLGKVGWYIGAKVDDEETWKRIKSGELKAFSIGGFATKQEM